MIKQFLGILAVLFLVGSAQAGTVVFSFGGSPVTITTVASQDVFLGNLLARENAIRIAGGEVAISLEQYLRDILVATLSGYRRQADDLDKIDACDRFKVLAQATQNQIKTTLGGFSPCP